MPNYDINYDDTRFKTVESQKSAALSENEKFYDSMISQSDKFYDKQIEASKQWADTQTKLQNEQTDFAIQKIEQEKAQAQKDYTREQSGAYQDWQKQSDQYGVRAEQIADKGMQTTGYSESSQVSMYNTYQNRVMTAREAYTRAVQDFNNGITEARLQNNSALAEIRFNALKQQLELGLQGFQAKNQLLLDKANQKLTIENNYYNRYQDVLQQINAENALAEEIRQHNENLAEEQRQFNYYNKLGEFAKKKSSGGSSSKSNSKKSSGGSAKITKSSTSSSSSKTSSNPTGLPKETANSILRYGGPQSPAEVDRKVKSGLLKETTSKKGNPVFRPSITNSMLYSSRRF